MEGHSSSTVVKCIITLFFRYRHRPEMIDYLHCFCLSLFASSYGTVERHHGQSVTSFFFYQSLTQRD